MKKFIFSIVLILTALLTPNAQTVDTFLVHLMNKNAERFATVMANPEKYRVQILYTQINRDEKNFPKFTSHSFRLNPNEYFYPASTVKFPACIQALEKINRQKDKKFTRNSIMLTDSIDSELTRQYTDSTNLVQNGFPSITNYIKKILLVSDNAFNRLFEFIGQEEFNTTLQKSGFPSTRIVHRLSLPVSQEKNKMSNAITFISESSWQNAYKKFVKMSSEDAPSIDKFLALTKTNEKLVLDNVYSEPKRVSKYIFPQLKPVLLGKGEMIDGKVTDKPKDFTQKNNFPLEAQQRMLRRFIFPEATPLTEQFNLTADDRKFMLKYMSQLPTESVSPPYQNDTSMHDNFCKYLMFGSDKNPIPNNIRIFNKIGDAYGFLTDNAYIVDFEKGVEFMLSATIYCNEDEIFNDDKYETQTIGLPFLTELGKTIYDYECARKRKLQPNLGEFKFNYDGKK
jgi:hypothetical protein